MASPHVAGAAALIKALQPTWSPGQVKSALMTTASAKGLIQEDGDPFTPFDAGSGRIDLGAVGAPVVTFDASAADYLTHAGELWRANYPSLYLSASAPDVVTVQRTARGEGGKDEVWSLEVIPAPG